MSVLAEKCEAASEAATPPMHGRCRIKLEALGVASRTGSGEALDAFDQPATRYLVARDEYGNARGSVRLLPTNQPYVLGADFPGLLRDHPAPRHPDVWELSRLVATDFNSETSWAGSERPATLAIRLLLEAMQCAAALGAKRLIAVAPIQLERLLRRAGIRTHRAGPPMIVNEHPLFACWIEVAPHSS